MNSQSLTTPQLTFRKTLDWAGSARAYTLAPIAIIALWPWFIGSFGENPQGYELPVSIHLFDLMTGLIPATVLTVFRWLLRANRPTVFRGSLVVNLLVWLFAAVLGVFLPLALVSVFGSIPAVYISGIPLGILSILGQILTCVLVSVVFTELHQSAKQLAKRQHALSVIQDGLERQIAAQRNALNKEVEGRLFQQIESLQTELRKLGKLATPGEARHLSDRIKSTIDQIVRPLSLEIAATSSDQNREQIRSLREIERQIKRLPFGERMRLSIPLGHVFNLPFVALFFLVFVFPSYTFLFGLHGMFVVGFTASLFTFTLMAIIRRFTRGVLVSFGLALVHALVGSAISAMPFAILGEILLPVEGASLVWFLTLEVFLVTAVSFYGSLFAETSFTILDRTRSANIELRKLVGFLQNESQINRRAMAQLVHGKIQARLQAASIRLLQAPQINERLLDEIAADLNAAILDTANTSLDRGTVEMQLAEMAAQWAGICDLTYTLEPGAAERANSSTTTKAAVVEIIREAVNNAVKHGEADEADVKISLSAKDELMVLVRNADYSGSLVLQSTNPRGYGSQILDQITDSWQLYFEDGDAILTARIKFSHANL